MNTSTSGVDELDPIEAIQQDVDSAAPIGTPTKDGYVILGEIDSEEGPPPVFGGPTN